MNEREKQESEGHLKIQMYTETDRKRHKEKRKYGRDFKISRAKRQR